MQRADPGLLFFTPRCFGQFASVRKQAMGAGALPQGTLSGGTVSRNPKQFFLLLLHTPYGGV